MLRRSTEYPVVDTGRIRGVPTGVQLQWKENETMGSDDNQSGDYWSRHYMQCSPMQSKGLELVLEYDEEWGLELSIYEGVPFHRWMSCVT